MNPPLVFVVHLAATLALAGLIWFVQVVHYPLFARVGADSFGRYAVGHQRLTTWVVAPLMILELLTGAVLAIDPVSGVPAEMLRVGFGLIVVQWLTTAVLAVPQHAILAGGFDAPAHRRLIAANTIRTAVWSVRAILVTWMVWILMV